jgi:predicted cation transporter
MPRRLSLSAHGALELLAGVLLIAAGFVLGLGPAGLVTTVTAGVLLAGLGLADDLPISTHMTADLALAAALLGGGAALARTGEPLAAILLAAAAAAELALSLGTRWTRRA